MRITVTSRFGVPAVLPQGETDGRAIAEFAYKKEATVWDGMKMLYCVEFDSIIGPELWTYNDLIAQTWNERGRSG